MKRRRSTRSAAGIQSHKSALSDRLPFLLADGVAEDVAGDDAVLALQRLGYGQLSLQNTSQLGRQGKHAPLTFGAACPGSTTTMMITIAAGRTRGLRAALTVLA
jgi:hypothetical protein